MSGEWEDHTGRDFINDWKGCTSYVYSIAWLHEAETCPEPLDYIKKLEVSFELFDGKQAAEIERTIEDVYDAAEAIRAIELVQKHLDALGDKICEWSEFHSPGELHQEVKRQRAAAKGPTF